MIWATYWRRIEGVYPLVAILRSEVRQMAIFGRELIGREVVDSHGEVLGQLIDIIFDNQLGVITEFLVKIGKDLNAELLPWVAKDGVVSVPVAEVSRIATKVHLTR